MRFGPRYSIRAILGRDQIPKFDPTAEKEARSEESEEKDKASHHRFNPPTREGVSTSRRTAQG